MIISTSSTCCVAAVVDVDVFVAVVFDYLEQQSDFMVYSTYCNSYPRALMELETYTGNSNAMDLLEKYVLSFNSHSQFTLRISILLAAMPIYCRFHFNKFVYLFCFIFFFHIIPCGRAVAVLGKIYRNCHYRHIYWRQFNVFVAIHYT